MFDVYVMNILCTFSISVSWYVTTGHSLEGSYPTAEVQPVYSAAPADWAN